MSQWVIAPYWVSERRARRDDAGRVYRVDHQFTELRITNPSTVPGRVDLVFYEARGDGNFYRSEWASAAYTAPPKWQRYYSPDPSRVFGDRFAISGWAELWSDRDEVVFDLSIRAIARNVLGGGSSGSGGVVDGISQRSVPLRKMRAPLFRILPEYLGFRPRSPLFPSDIRPLELRPSEEPIQPDE